MLKRRFRAPALAVPRTPSRVSPVDELEADDDDDGISAQSASSSAPAEEENPVEAERSDVYFDSLDAGAADSDDLLPGISGEFRFAPEPEQAPRIEESPLMDLEEAIGRIPEALRASLKDRLRAEFREVRRLPRKDREA